MYKIKREVLGAIIEASKNTYPHEFFGVLGGSPGEKIVDELIVVPATYGKNFTLIKTYLIPFDSKMIGTVHSHPSYSSRPSKQDIATFGKMGSIHLIIAYPFNSESFNAFDSKGIKTAIELI